MKLLALFALGARAAPQLSWLSQPVLPGETVVVQGHGFTNSSLVLLTPLGASSPQTLKPEQVTDDGAVLKFVLPTGAPAAYEVAVKEAGGASKALKLNVPDIFWAHGDAHDSCTPGGFLRVFGKALHFPETSAAKREELAAAREALRAAIENGDEENVGKAAVAVARLRKELTAAAELPTLKLEGAGAPVLLKATENATGYSTYFRLPADLKAGEYKVSLANNIAPNEFSPMSTFLSPQQPAVQTVKVVARQEWPSKRFVVTDYDTEIGKVPRNGEKTWKDASPAFQKALDDAAKEGGVVFFPRGQYLLNSSAGFTVPWNVKLLGESRETVALYLFEANKSTAPQAYFRSPGTKSIDPEPEKAGTGRWAIEELTVYVTGFHNYIFLVNNRTTGFRMHRCRIQANAYLGSNGPFTHRDITWKNFTLEEPLAVVGLNNCRNWELTENHLYGTYDVIQSYIHGSVCSKNDMSGCHGASWGWVADNAIFNGGASHFMNQWNQVIVERNTMTGVSPIAMGNSVGTGPGGGHDHNLYHGENTIRFVQGNDQEIITFDNAGGAYFGTIAKVEGAKVTFAYDARSSGSPEWGGWGGAGIVVLNGTGVGQWRRIVVPGIDAEPSNPNNRSWVLDRPFDIMPGTDSVVQVMPFRGRIIFHGDRFMDGGNVQFYGQAIDVLVVNNVAERIAGFAAWGQWRGCQLFKYCDGPGALGTTGQMGNGIMPNVAIQYINNTVVEGNKVVRFTARDSGGSFALGMGKFLGGASFMIQGAGNVMDGIFMSMNVLFRRNRVLNNGGFNLGWGQGKGVRDILVEGNVVENTDADRALQVGKGIMGLLVRENKLPSEEVQVVV